MSQTPQSPAAQSLAARISDRTAVIGVIGLGYVGLPLSIAFGDVGFSVLGFDVDATKAEQLNAGESYIKTIDSARIAALRAAGRLEATADMARLSEVDAILICVPTPLSEHRTPDLRFVRSTAATVALQLRPGQLVVLESTTYPGTTAEVVRPALETRRLAVGEEVFLAYSPEREDPGNIDFTTTRIPKVVGADDAVSGELATALYAAITETVPVSSAATAEAVKITENVFRAVNIALVNELKVIYESLGIDVWEVVEAAKTKPFGYMPFYPGPGLGGHCIPIDPFYLTWKARETGLNTRFIELAGEINTAMPEHVVDRVARALDDRFAKGLNGARILVVGVAYKKNVDDTRESPALRLMELLEGRKATVAFHDPHVETIPPLREHPQLEGRRSTPLLADTVSGFDAVLVATDHDAVDYAALTAAARLVVDTRNACARSGADVDLSKVVMA